VTLSPGTPAGDDRPRRAGFFLPLETMVRPRRAFATIRESPEWIPAFALCALFGVVGVVLAAPAMLHATTSELVSVQGLGQGDALRIGAQRIVQFQLDQLLVPLLSWAFAALVFSAVARGTMPPLRAFAVYFSLGANVGVIDALSTLVTGAVVRTHDPNAFGSFREIVLAVPDSLASLRPDGTTTEVLALGNWDVFAFWSQILLGYGFSAISGRKLLPSLLLSFGVGLALWYVFLFLG